MVLVIMHSRKRDKHARAKKGQRTSFTELKKFSIYAIKHGSAAKHWLFCGKDKSGSGVRKSTKQLKLGESQNQNGILKLTGQCHRTTVSSIYLSICIAIYDLFSSQNVRLIDQMIVIQPCTSLSVVQKVPKIVSHTSYYKMPEVMSWVVSLYHTVCCGAPAHSEKGNM